MIRDFSIWDMFCLVVTLFPLRRRWPAARSVVACTLGSKWASKIKPGFAAGEPRLYSRDLRFEERPQMATCTRRRLIRLSLLAAATVVLNACGQKGPLYLPDEEGDEKKKKEKTTGPGQPRSPRA
jgi:predicted small lipoprotein YifL